MKITLKQHLLIGMAVLIGAAAPGYSFTSTKIRRIVARVTVSSDPSFVNPIDFEIRHTPLQGISAVNRMAIIQGEVGRDVEAINPSFGQRFKPGDPYEGSTGVRIHLRYRIDDVLRPDPSLQTQSVQLKEHDSTQITIEGPDPMGFAFQIPPEDVFDGSIINYQLVAERLENGVVLERVGYPQGAENDSHLFVSVGVAASAADVVDSPGAQIEFPDGNPNDGVVALAIPSGVISDPSVVRLNQVPLDSPGVPPFNNMAEPVVVYRLDGVRSFDRPARVTVVYPDFLFPEGQDGVLDGTSIPESQATLAWWDGFEWRNIGGIRNADLNTLTASIKSFEYIGVFSVGAPSAAAAAPAERVVTPNDDGVNDEANFGFGGSSADAVVEIFDTTGYKVRTLRSPNNLTWNGRDDSGQVVESGVYIYQYVINGSRVSGAIAVVK